MVIFHDLKVETELGNHVGEGEEGRKGAIYLLNHLMQVITNLFHGNATAVLAQSQSNVPISLGIKRRANGRKASEDVSNLAEARVGERGEEGRRTGGRRRCVEAQFTFHVGFVKNVMQGGAFNATGQRSWELLLIMKIETECDFGSIAHLSSNTNDLTEFFQEFTGDFLGTDIFTSGFDQNLLLGVVAGAARPKTKKPDVVMREGASKKVAFGEVTINGSIVDSSFTHMVTL